MSYRWLRDGVSVGQEGRRSRLPKAVAPGATCAVHMLVDTPPAEGQYVLAIDLVHEGVTWFSETGQVPCRIAVKVRQR